MRAFLRFFSGLPESTKRSALPNSRRIFEKALMPVFTAVATSFSTEFALVRLDLGDESLLSMALQKMGGPNFPANFPGPNFSRTFEFLHLLPKIFYQILAHTMPSFRLRIVIAAQRYRPGSPLKVATFRGLESVDSWARSPQGSGRGIFIGKR